MNRAPAAGAFVRVAAFLLVLGVATIGSSFSLLLGGILAALALLAAVALYFRKRLPQVTAGVMTLLLTGYAIGGRGFAYLGFPPLFVGELALALGLTAALVAGSLRGRWTLAAGAIVMFELVGLVTTVPYVSAYGIDAFRDGVTWAYSIFALVIIGLAGSRFLPKVVARYSSLLPYFLATAPVVLAVNRWAPQVIPLNPITDIPLFAPKSGDVSVHLAGVATFLLLDLRSCRFRQRNQLLEWLLWSLWLAAFVLITNNRGGMISILIAMSIALLFRPRSRWGKPLVVVAIAVGLASGLQLGVNNNESRGLSVQDIALRLQSVVSSTGDSSVDGTKEWRLNWWQDIVDYTVFGPYRWLGKGYGVNLADDDGYQVDAEGDLRSPHSIHLSVLARSGLLGLGAWLSILLLVLIGLTRIVLYGLDETRRRVALWLLSYFLAFVVNASFDVYLEGPQGGIWFWSLVGVACVLILQKDRPLRAQEPLPTFSA